MVVQTNEGEFKGKTLQEYLNWKYPTREDKEEAKAIISSWMIENLKRGIWEKLELGELDLREFKNVSIVHVNKVFFKTYLTKLNVSGLENLRKLRFVGSKITSLDLSDCFSLEEILCHLGELTSINFLNTLPLPESLETLSIYDNNIEPTDIAFSKFVNLKTLKIGTDKLLLELGETEKLNQFYGSLKSLKNLTKLESIDIEATDIDSGLEYLPKSLAKATRGGNYYNIQCSPHNTNAKCSAIQNELRPFNYDLEAWQLAHLDLMAKVWREQNKYKFKQAIISKIQKNQQQLNCQLSWKTKVKHLTLGGLIALGAKETYSWHYGESNLTPFPVSNNSTWLEKVYANIPFNELEYKNLTSLLGLEVVKSILFPNSLNNPSNLESEITRLKINDLNIQIQNQETELAKTITNTKNKLSKAENYLLAQLLTKNNSKKQTELKEVLQDYQTEIELILDKKQELNDLQKHLEKLQAIQKFEAKIEY